jgi:hypothetical protein
MALEPLTQGLDDSVERLDKETNDTKQGPGMKLDIEKGAAQQDHTANGKVEAANGAPATHDWNGPDDRENPQNWPFVRKTYQTAVVGFLAFG